MQTLRALLLEQLISQAALAHFRAATVVWKIKLAEIVTVPNSTLARTANARVRVHRLNASTGDRTTAGERNA